MGRNDGRCVKVIAKGFSVASHSNLVDLDVDRYGPLRYFPVGDADYALINGGVSVPSVS